jgi:hypothetical protein
VRDGLADHGKGEGRREKGDNFSLLPFPFCLFFFTPPRGRGFRIACTG